MWFLLVDKKQSMLYQIRPYMLIIRREVFWQTTPNFKNLTVRKAKVNYSTHCRLAEYCPQKYLWILGLTHWWQRDYMLVPLYTDMNMNRDRLSIKMARLVTRPSTAQCTLPMYIGFLISEPKFVSCQRVAEVLNISHDSVNRFLQRESYTPLDLYN